MKRNNLYIIGLGKHVIGKIIPAIEKLGIKINGILSNNTDHNYPDLSNEDLNKLSYRGSNFIISGIPIKHVELLNKISHLDARVLIEKPLFVDFEILYKNKNKFIKHQLTEAMMYKFNLGFRYFRYIHDIEEKKIKHLLLQFVLPLNSKSLKESFRHTKNIKNSIIYDIGYYIFDLLWSLKIDILNINIKSINWFPDKILKNIGVELECMNSSRHYKVNFEIGYGDKYMNEVTMMLQNYNIVIEPFFSGREGDVNIIKIFKNHTKKVSKRSKNSYEKMIKYWYNNRMFRNSLGLDNYTRFKTILFNLKKIEEKIKSYDIRSQ